jgi:hypothetical protein
MTRFGESRFSVGSNSKSAAKAYRDNWESVFGKKKPKAEDEKGRHEAARFESWQDGYEDDDGTPRQG